MKIHRKLRQSHMICFALCALCCEAVVESEQAFHYFRDDCSFSSFETQSKLCEAPEMSIFEREHATEAQLSSGGSIARRIETVLFDCCWCLSSTPHLSFRNLLIFCCCALELFNAFDSLETSTSFYCFARTTDVFVAYKTSNK